MELPPQLSESQDPKPVVIELADRSLVCVKTAKDDEGCLSVFQATCMLMTWSTSSSNVMYPWTFGVLGLVGGPLLMAVAFLINWQCTRWVIHAARATKSSTFGELGEALGGWTGRVVFKGSQLLFQQLFLPVAIVLSAKAIQSLFASNSAFLDCNGNATVLLVVVGLGLIQVSRQLEHAIWFAYVSIGLLVVQTIAIVYATTATDPPSAVVDATSAGGDSGWEYFTGMGSHGERYSWENVCAALGVFIYSCLPNCIVVEVMATMPAKHQHRMTWAVDASFAFYIVCYLLTGLPAVLGWGGDIENPITNVMRNDWSGVIAKLVLVYSTMLDFVLASTTINREVMAWISSWNSDSMFAPPKEFRWTDPVHAAQWCLYSLPSAMVAMIMALLLPRLESLTGLLNSIAGTTVQVTAIAAAAMFWSRRMFDAAPSATCPWHQILAGALAIYGVGLTVVILAEAVANVAQTDYSTGNFWCDIVG